MTRRLRGTIGGPASRPRQREEGEDGACGERGEEDGSRQQEGEVHAASGADSFAGR